MFRPLLAALLLIFPALAQAEEVTVYTGTFRPFVVPEAEASGPGLELVDLVISNADDEAVFARKSFVYGFHRVANGEEALSFPWRQTPERSERVLFSVPLLTLQHALHHMLPAGGDGSLPELGAASIGLVTSYEYVGDIGELIEKAEAEGRAATFNTEAGALGALLRGRIDYLPLPAPVVRATLEADFPNQTRLVRPLVEGPTEIFTLHAIAPRTPWGEAQIRRFDESYTELRAAEVITDDFLTESLARPQRSDIAVLVSAEGFPVIKGALKDDPSTEFALPRGTRVLVREWSVNYSEPTEGTTLYRIMTSPSLVLVLNGPHLGKELYIQNMHLTLAE
jgi:polar amino acid transport system substrate-binding protein